MPDKKELIKEILRLLPVSTMNTKERTLWLLITPTLSDTNLLKLKEVLKKEVDALTDLYLNAATKQ